MIYKNTKEFQNTYPLDYFIQNNSIIIEGLENKRSVNIPSLNNIKYVNGTSFPFIIKFYLNDRDDDVEEIRELWTSEEYYTLLRNSIRDRNPFYSVETSTIIKIYLPQFISIIKSETQFASQLGLNIERVLGINATDFTDIDYSVLVKYIDWSVQQTDRFEVSLLPTDTLIQTTIDF